MCPTKFHTHVEINGSHRYVQAISSGFMVMYVVIVAYYPLHQSVCATANLAGTGFMQTQM
jgi:hypothetical protein